MSAYTHQNNKPVYLLYMQYLEQLDLHGLGLKFPSHHCATIRENMGALGILKN